MRKFEHRTSLNPTCAGGTGFPGAAVDVGFYDDNASNFLIVDIRERP